jgi:hypothetical protein
MDLIEFFQRAKNLVTGPVEEWQVIKEEQTDRSGVVRNYVLPFIFLLAITTFLGIFLFRNFVTISIMALGALVTSLGAFLSVYISAYIINELAPRFESKKDFTSSFKLVTYSYTAIFIAHSIASLILPLYFLVIFGLYSVYILWTGLGTMMETPGENRVIYGIICSVTILVAYVLLNTGLGALSTSLFVSYGMNTLTLS